MQKSSQFDPSKKNTLFYICAILTVTVFIQIHCYDSSISSEFLAGKRSVRALKKISKGHIIFLLQGWIIWTLSKQIKPQNAKKHAKYTDIMLLVSDV